MKRTALVGAVCLVFIACVGCRAPVAGKKGTTGTDGLRPGVLAVKDYPKVDGSTSAQPLQFLIACHLLGGHCAWWPSWSKETSGRKSTPKLGK